jgi:hypothetical protein
MLYLCDRAADVAGVENLPANGESRNLNCGSHASDQHPPGRWCEGQQEDNTVLGWSG